MRRTKNSFLATLQGNKSMYQCKRILLIALAPIVLLAVSAEAGAQASDVECTKCVDTTDIASKAITTGKIDTKAVTTVKIADRAITSNKIAAKSISSSKIKNGAVTVAKVVPKLSNSIGTFCAPGQVVVGKDFSGNLVCEARDSTGPDYFPYGPQVNVHPSRLNEWQECYSDLYSNTGTPIATIFGQCNRSMLILACREVGQTNYQLLAAGNRADVVMDTSNDLFTTNLANGVEWYFHGNSKSWGFAGEGDTVRKNPCDDQSDGDNDQRLCWHTANQTIDAGFRCGADLSLGVNWERKIFHAGAAPQ